MRENCKKRLKIGGLMCSLIIICGIAAFFKSRKSQPANQSKQQMLEVNNSALNCKSFIKPPIQNDPIEKLPPIGTFKVGDSVAGGIIYYLDLIEGKPDTIYHAFICAPFDQSTGTTWNEAIKLCKSLRINGYSDWQLPTKLQLQVMAENLGSVGLAGLANKDHSFKPYWSSTEDAVGNAWNVAMDSDGTAKQMNKLLKFRVRAIRVF